MLSIGRLAPGRQAAAYFLERVGCPLDYWQQMIAVVLRGYLHAAALSGRAVRDILAWSSRPSDPTPVRILKSELNRPGMSGDSIPWKGWGHVSEYVEEVSGRAA
ncbi:MAG: hypothetical protein JWO88_3240 [Frankiales bacterium]|nr:hypothetical protein [Frankiales bacterium]